MNEKLELLNSGKNIDDSQMKLSEARKLAIDIRLDRWRLNILQIQRREYDQYTVEGQTENARFDCLASLCILDEEGNRLFKSVDDYYDSADETYINEAAAKLANMMFGTEDWQKKLPENEFLNKHNMVDDNGRLINKDGQFIDSEGQVLTEEEVKKQDKEAEFIDDLA
jgi:hypothetical protein